MKSDAHTGVQRTKCFIEYKSGLEAEDSFQTEVATNERTGLDVELLDNRTSGERRRSGAADISGTRNMSARSAWYSAPDPVSGGGALCTGAVRRSRGRTKHRGLRRPRAAAAGQVGQSRGTKGFRGQGSAALTWMVQVYSLSSSSRTVQLYSRSRLLLLPLINLLSIFPPARPPPGETRRRCGPRTRRPSAGQLLAGPGHLHHHPSRVAAAASCCPSSSFFSSFFATASPQPRASAPLSLLRAPLPMPSSWGGASAGEGPMGVSAAEPSGREKSQSRPGVGTRLDKCLLRGIRLDCASGAKSHTLQRRESRPLGSRGGARKQSPHLQNAGTFRSGPGGCPHLSCTPRCHIP
ncbi:uncharacterized protein LOC122468027 [Prionailurus bengalensis]|uniref:uncharacterized protein LOC122468027 n=1 Tax=Prionailurus bengalensis TaxID=37029 RepID=UPI001CA858FC|nr:uncharacterized protein LOC122468027 [Prionailurus bengalensis]